MVDRGASADRDRLARAHAVAVQGDSNAIYQLGEAALGERLAAFYERGMIPPFRRVGADERLFTVESDRTARQSDP